MKKAFMVILVAVVALACVFAGGKKESSEASDKAYVQKNGKLIVGITDFEPMDYMEGGKWVGFDADMAKEFAKSLGVDCEFIEINWDSKEMELANKTIDCVWNGMTLTDGVKKAMETSNAYCNNAQIIVTKKNLASSLKNAADAKDLQFAVEGGSAGMEAAADNGYKYIEVETQADAVMEVAAGTSQACIIDSLMAAAMVGPGTSYPDLAYSVALTTEEYGVGFRKGSDLAAALNAFFKDAYKSGLMLKVAEQYGTQASIIEQ